MPTRRRSTVHDLASLRIHPDGSRVQQSASNTKLRTSQYTTRDSRGNWIARDAGGLGLVKTRRDLVQETGEEEEEIDPNASQVEATSTGNGKGKDVSKTTSDRGSRQPKDHRAKKRREFANNYEFLGGPPTSDSHHISYFSVNTEAPSSSAAVIHKFFPQPSSDLLKCIHHFAGHYYSDRGQLSDVSREYRRAKKVQRLKKLSQSNFFKLPVTRVGPVEGNDEPRDQSDSTSDAGEQGESVLPVSGKKVISSKKSLGKDMYKAFDGSALIAIGMLLQSHVANMMSAGLPKRDEPGQTQDSSIAVNRRFFAENNN